MTPVGGYAAAMMGEMTSSDTPRPHLPGASTRPKAVKPSVAWVYVGAVVALLGIVVGVGMVAVGFLADGGPDELGRTDFPGQVEFTSEKRPGLMGIYLERSTLSGDPALPGYLDPIVSRGDGEVQVDSDPDLPRHSGVSSELVPIGSFSVVGGDYTVTVDPDSTTERADVAVVVADPNPEGSGSDLMLWGGIGGLVAVVAGAGLSIGASRARQRGRMRALAASRGADGESSS